MARRFESPEQFVRAYMEAYRNGETFDELAARFGTTHKSILSKVGKFRMSGVKLPRLKTKRDVDAVSLNKIVEEMSGDPSEGKVDNSYFNATCANCGRRFYTKSGLASKCVNCIKKTKPVHPVPTNPGKCEICGEPCRPTDFVCSDKCSDAYWSEHK